ncbi:MAG: thiamine pyrophosphate-binding protein [Pseudomonadota bacterium]|nr:thiamine pyrophosphate-binding protein [Pseudomonadota bacterium]
MSQSTSTAGAPSGGERIAEALQAQGVGSLYTLCGGHISPILAAARARGIRVLDVRHEATAVFAADAAARLTGVPGVAVVTAGPGVSNTLTALKNAQLAQSPLVLIGGAAPTVLQKRGALQDIDQAQLVTGQVKWLRRVRRVADLAPAIAEAFAVARDGVPGPVFVECPVDLLYDEAVIRGWYADAGARGKSLAERLQRWYLRRHVARMFAGRPAVQPVREVRPQPPARVDVERAAAALMRARRPLLLVGSQAVIDAANADRVAAAISALQLPFYLSGMARGLLGPAHPRQLFHQRRQALREADCVLLAGVPCDFRLDYGRHVRRSARLIVANRSRREARLNRTPTVAAPGDAGLFLEALAARLASNAGRDDWQAVLHGRDAGREAEIAREAEVAGEYVNPLALFREIDRIAGDQAIFVADGGDFVATAAYTLRPRGPLRWLDPGVFGTLGVGAGFALGASANRPGAELWLIWGDGACGFSLVEFDSFVRHGIPLIAVVGNDAGWSQIAREQVKLLGDAVGTTLARSDYHQVAAALGAEGILVRHMHEMPGALARAQALARSGRPVLVNVWLDSSGFREGSISM